MCKANTKMMCTTSDIQEVLEEVPFGSTIGEWSASQLTEPELRLALQSNACVTYKDHLGKSAILPFPVALKTQIPKAGQEEKQARETQNAGSTLCPSSTAPNRNGQLSHLLFGYVSLPSLQEKIKHREEYKCNLQICGCCQQDK